MSELQGSLEQNVLTMLVWSEPHAAAISMQLSADIFSATLYRKVADKAIEYLITYGKPPGAHMRDLLENDLRRGADGRALSAVIDDIDNLAPYANADYVMAELTKFIALRRLTISLEAALEQANRGDLDAAEQAIYEREITTAASPGIWLHDDEKMLGFLKRDATDVFPSGIEVLDDKGIRPARKQIMLIIGAKKVGKSWFLIDIGRRAIHNNKSVLHVSLENSEELTAQRYTQGITAMTSRKEGSQTIRVPQFMRDQLGRFTHFDYLVRTPEVLNDETKDAAARKLRSLKSRQRLLIKEFPTGSLTIAQLSAYLDMLDRQENFRPDLLLLDSVNKMSIRGEHLRIDLGRNLVMLRGLAVARNMAIVTPTHSNRQGDSAKWVTGAAHVGEDYSMLGTADTVLTISRTATEKEHGLARILVDAARDAEDKFSILISQNYATGQFCLDSTYLSKFVEQEIDRVSGNKNSEDD